jgi:hypothetical protein
MALYSTAGAEKFDHSPIPELRVVEKPLCLVGTQVQAHPLPGSWRAFTEDGFKFYEVDSRWCGRFHVWTLEINGEWGRRLKRRQGYWDSRTGIYIYSGPKE